MESCRKDLLARHFRPRQQAQRQIGPPGLRGDRGKIEERAFGKAAAKARVVRTSVTPSCLRRRITWKGPLESNGRLLFPSFGVRAIS